MARLPVSASLLLAAALAVLAAGTAVAEHPVEGVIKLFGELQDTAKEEGVTDTGNYNAYAKWCAESTETLNAAIKKEKSEVARLEDKITGLKDEIEVLDNDITYLGKQIEEQQNAATKAKKIRDDADALYSDEQSNLESTVDAVSVATDAMKDSQTGLLQTNGDKKIRKAAVLTEYKMDAKTHSMMKRFLKEQKHTEDPSVPKEDYVDKSGAVIETFEGMSEDFVLEKSESVESQTKDKNDYNRAKTARDAAIQAAQDAKSTKETSVADKRSAKAQAESDQKAEEKALVSDSTTLDNTLASCQDMKNQFEERTKTRNDEIDAMKMAAKILEKVTGVRNPDTHEAPTHTGSGPDLIQKVKKGQAESKKALRGVFDYGKGDDVAMGLVQVARKHRHRVALAKDAKDATSKVAALIRRASGVKHASHVKALSQLADAVQMYEGPFDKIIQMVEKMIFHIMSEQKEEDDMKNWCDLETEKSTEKKEDRTTKVREFTIKLESMDAMVQTLTGEIVAAQRKIKSINEYMKEETDLRKENHKEAVLTIKDSKDGQAALKNAIGVLTKFYKDSGMIAKEPWEFLQTSKETAHAPGDTVSLSDSPSTWDASYTGVSDPKNGDNAVLTLLEETNTKFADMEATTKANDETDQKNFNSDMQAQKIELEETKTDEEMKNERRSSLEEKIEGMTEGKKHLAREKSAVVAYLKDLETPCSMGDDSYEDRKKARTDELEALREAQIVLVDTQKEIVDKAEHREKNKKEYTKSGDN